MKCAPSLCDTTMFSGCEETLQDFSKKKSWLIKATTPKMMMAMMKMTTDFILVPPLSNGTVPLLLGLVLLYLLRWVGVDEDLLPPAAAACLREREVVWIVVLGLIRLASEEEMRRLVSAIQSSPSSLQEPQSSLLLVGFGDVFLFSLAEVTLPKVGGDSKSSSSDSSKSQSSSSSDQDIFSLERWMWLVLWDSGMLCLGDLFC